MNISIFGLGYVGCVGIGCMAKLGHNVIGVDTSYVKVQLIRDGIATIVEKEIDGLIKQGVLNGQIRSTHVAEDAVNDSDVAIICVGTPNDRNGHLNLEYIYSVAREIGNALRHKNTFFTIAICSTVLPGTNKKVTNIITEQSGKTANKDFGVVSNPEFLREGTAVQDFMNPPYTVFASDCLQAIEQMKQAYDGVSGHVVVTQIGVAELIKLLNNSYHALKVSFANEIGRICKKVGVDSHQLMDVFIRDTQLNISPKYFLPGFSYGGSCLPKDLKALNMIAHDLYVDVPVLSHIEVSNQRHLEFIYKHVVLLGKKNIGFYGISFKSGTDDLRFSPGLELAERLIGKGMNVSVYDCNINLSKLMGKNKEFLYEKLPHINRILFSDMKEFIDRVDVILLANKDEHIDRLRSLLTNRQKLIDLTRVDELKDYENYEGICW